MRNLSNPRFFPLCLLGNLLVHADDVCVLDLEQEDEGHEGDEQQREGQQEVDLVDARDGGCVEDGVGGDVADGREGGGQDHGAQGDAELDGDGHDGHGRADGVLTGLPVAPGRAHGVEVGGQAIGEAKENLGDEEQHVEGDEAGLDEEADDADDGPAADADQRGVLGADLLGDAGGDEGADEAAEEEDHEDGAGGRGVAQDDLGVVGGAGRDGVEGDHAQDVVDHDADQVGVGDDVLAHGLEGDLLALGLRLGVVAGGDAVADVHGDHVDDGHDRGADAVGVHAADDCRQAGGDQRDQLGGDDAAQGCAGAEAAGQEGALGGVVSQDIGHGADARVGDVPAEVAHDVADRDDDAGCDVTADLGEAQDEEDHGDGRGDEQPGAVLALLEVALVDEDAREQRGDGVDGGRAGGDDARDGQRQLGDVGQEEQEERRLESRGYREAYLGHPPDGTYSSVDSWHSFSSLDWALSPYAPVFSCVCQPPLQTG